MKINWNVKPSFLIDMLQYSLIITKCKVWLFTKQTVLIQCVRRMAFTLYK